MILLISANARRMDPLTLVVVVAVVSVVVTFFDIQFISIAATPPTNRSSGPLSPTPAMGKIQARGAGSQPRQPIA